MHVVRKFTGKMPDANLAASILCEPAQSKCTWTSIEHWALPVTVRTPQCGHTVWGNTVYVYIYMYTYMYIYINMCVYIYIHTHRNGTNFYPTATWYGNPWFFQGQWSTFMLDFQFSISMLVYRRYHLVACSNDWRELGFKHSIFPKLYLVDGLPGWVWCHHLGV